MAGVEGSGASTKVPILINAGGDLPSCIRRSRLIELKEAITAIYEMYGAKNPEDRSFAKRVKEGLLDSAIAEYTGDIEKFVLELKDLVRLSPELTSRVETGILMHEGKLNEAEQRLTADLASKPSNPAAVHHDLGTLLLEYRRNPEAALPHLLKASELAPNDADSAHRAAHLLAFFKRIGEARTHALRAKASTNFPLLEESSQAFVNNLITTTNHLC